jgi:lysophospholipase L1-like esterase
MGLGDEACDLYVRACGQSGFNGARMTVAPWLDAGPFVRGAAWLAADMRPPPDAHPRTWLAATDVRYPRVRPGDSRIPLDTFDAGTLPVGLRLEALSDARAIDIEVTSRGAAPGLPEGQTSLELWADGSLIDVRPAPVGTGVVRLDTGPGRVTVYLPHEMRPLPLQLRAVDGNIEPAPAQSRWLAYGDSITEGANLSAPSRAWPALVARELGFEVVNLGFAGAARGELALAEQMAMLDADVMSVAVGTNCWRRVPTSVEQMAANIDAFLAVLKQERPEVPVILVSPLLRPDAEATANRLGATLTDLREAIEQAGARQSNVHVISGVGIVTASQLPDGLHPEETGHEAIADAVVKAARLAFTGRAATRGT